MSTRVIHLCENEISQYFCLPAGRRCSHDSPLPGISHAHLSNTSGGEGEGDGGGNNRKKKRVKSRCISCRKTIQHCNLMCLAYFYPRVYNPQHMQKAGRAGTWMLASLPPPASSITQRTQRSGPPPGIRDSNVNRYSYSYISIS